MKRKKERNKYTASKKEPTLLLHNLMTCIYIFQQRKKERNKQTKWHVRPAKTQISLGIRPVWSEFSLSP